MPEWISSWPLIAGAVIVLFLAARFLKFAFGLLGKVLILAALALGISLYFGYRPSDPQNVYNDAKGIYQKYAPVDQWALPVSAEQVNQLRSLADQSSEARKYLEKNIGPSFRMSLMKFQELETKIKEILKEEKKKKHQQTP